MDFTHFVSAAGLVDPGIVGIEKELVMWKLGWVLSELRVAAAGGLIMW